MAVLSTAHEGASRCMARSDQATGLPDKVGCRPVHPFASHNGGRSMGGSKVATFLRDVV